jgi:hypothetical protein
VYTADTIHEAIGLFTGVEPGHRDESGEYPPHSVLGRAVERARAYWDMARQSGAPAPRAPENGDA